jgi:DinB superfamily
MEEATTERKARRMTTESSFTDLALRSWKATTQRADAFFGELSEEQLQAEIAPGRNRLIYLWGHLTAFNDALLPLLGLGKRLHPELDAMFVSNPDRKLQNALSGKELKRIWQRTNDTLWAEFSKLTPSEWLEKHNAVSEEDFAREPHRNRFTVLLGRTGHLAYHLGQAMLAKRTK